jgi:hypothetical protein
VRPTGGDSFVQIINGTNGYNVEQLFVILQNFSQPLAKAVYDKFRVRIGPISTIDAIIP